MTRHAASRELPRWIDFGVIPFLNLASALIMSGIVVMLIGENPIEVVILLISGAFGFLEAIGYTMFYATNFLFTGLAVAVAFHCGLFNIGGEGQAYVGGLGITIACLYFEFLPFVLIVPFAIGLGMLFGAGWAFIPGYLQAKRGSHVVITTIMFNSIAGSLMVYLLVNVMIKPGQQSPETRIFEDHAQLPFIHDLLGGLGIGFDPSPWNMAFLIGLVACVFVWLLIWHTRWGYAIRTSGANASAAIYGGIKPDNQIIVAMMISGALAGMMGLNEVMGAQHRLTVGFTAGYGFVGIAVALMGRNHPFGIIFAAILFGALYQGGAEVAFEIPTITGDIVVVIQGLVILFTGALEHMYRPRVAALHARWVSRRLLNETARQGA